MATQYLNNQIIGKLKEQRRKISTQRRKYFEKRANDLATRIDLTYKGSRVYTSVEHRKQNSSKAGMFIKALMHSSVSSQAKLGAVGGERYRTIYQELHQW